jgi:tRNA(fMet)-specific endonuclease VapC
MIYLLDTNACVVYLTGRSDTLRRRIDAAGDQDLVVCSVVRAELCYGAAKSLDPPRTLKLQHRFLDRFRSLAFDDAAARVYGPIRAALERSGTPIGAHDLLIASIGLANGLIVVTHNVNEFTRVPGLAVEDWERVTT